MLKFEPRTSVLKALCGDLTLQVRRRPFSVPDTPWLKSYSFHEYVYLAGNHCPVSGTVLRETLPTPCLVHKIK